MAFNDTYELTTMDKLEFASGRLAKDIEEFVKSPVPGVKITFESQCIFDWTVCIRGRRNSLFYIALSFKKEYPFRPPLVKMLTPIYRSSYLDPDGNFKLWILRKWTAAVTMRHLLTIISRKLIAKPPKPLFISVQQRGSN